MSCGIKIVESIDRIFAQPPRLKLAQPLRRLNMGRSLLIKQRTPNQKLSLIYFVQLSQNTQMTLESTLLALHS